VAFFYHEISGESFAGAVQFREKDSRQLIFINYGEK
jgi:hypothetical protein